MFRSVLLHIDPNLCQACQRCAAAKACRTKAIVQIDPARSPYLEADRCRDCWACLPACQFGAVKKLNREE